MTRREAIVAAALAEEGSTDAAKYWEDVLGGRPPYPKHWCGAFALWCCHQAGVALGKHWVVAKGAFGGLPTTRRPQPGDVAYFEEHQHHAVVRDIDGPGNTWRAINGNGAGGAVSLGDWQPHRGAVFFSIQPWIDALGEDDTIPPAENRSEQDTLDEIKKTFPGGER